MSEKISSTILKRLAEKGLLKTVLAAAICDKAQAVAEGEFEVISFKKGVLKIRVGSAVKAQLLKLKERQLILEINENLKAEKIKRFSFEIK